jgi:hypothetical protein
VLWLILPVGVVAVGAVYVYVWRERLGVHGVALAGLRTLALACLLALLGNVTREIATAPGPATVLLDASLSLQAAGGRWGAALDTARRLAAGGGVVLRFGENVASFDTTPPDAGRSLAGPALRVAATRRGPVLLVTDGELSDFGTLPTELTRTADVVLLPRDTVPDAALTEVALPRAATADDSVTITVTVSTWGALDDSVGLLEVSSGARRLARRSVTLPPAPGTARRSVTLPAGTLPAGAHVLDTRLSVAGDREPRDDLRQRAITITALPAVVLLARPPDWESRFLARELPLVVRSAVRSYAEVAAGRWVNMETGESVSEDRVRAAARQAALIVTRGPEGFTRGAAVAWRWPAAGDVGGGPDGDWYVTGPGATPLAGALGAIEWDSLPPLPAVLAATDGDRVWSVLAARLGRRGPGRPVVIAHDAVRSRLLVTQADGLWRWALRGGAALEGYRALLAAGTDWLLGSPQVRGHGRLRAAEVVSRGLPVVFQWLGDSAPAAVDVDLTGPDSTWRVTLALDGNGAAQTHLEPGVYHWRAAGPAAASGIVIVEPYSDEWHPGPVTASGQRAVPVQRAAVGVRALWWVFAVAIGALLVEWGWRIRRGLP